MFGVLSLDEFFVPLGVFPEFFSGCLPILLLLVYHLAQVELTSLKKETILSLIFFGTSLTEDSLLPHLK